MMLDNYKQTSQEKIVQAKSRGWSKIVSAQGGYILVDTPAHQYDGPFATLVPSEELLRLLSQTTIRLLGIQQMNLLWVTVLGDNKKKAIDDLFKGGLKECSEETTFPMFLMDERTKGVRSWAFHVEYKALLLDMCMTSPKIPKLQSRSYGNRWFFACCFFMTQYTVV